VIRSIDDGLVLINADCKVTDMNPMTGSTLQVDPEKVVTRHFLEVVKDEKLFNYIKQSIDSGESPRIKEKHKVLTMEHNGGRRHYQFSVTPLHGRTGSLSGMVLLLRDVTRLTELDRMKTEFVMTVSHELRTPLTSIGMSIDLLLKSAQKKLDDEEQKLLSATHEDLQCLTALVNNLLGLSRIEAGKMEMEFSGQPVHPLLEKVVASFRIPAEQKGVALSFQVPEGLPDMKADGNRIAWVLTNLISNALHFTPKGGAVRLNAGTFGPFIQISVIDNGSGIPYEYQAKNFDKFVQVKSDKILGGGGLGLAICREIVRAHRGHNLGGFGSRSGEHVPLHASCCRADPKRGKNMKGEPVLIVDDEKNILLTLSQSPEALQLETDTATNGEGTLAKLKEKEFDLILLDIRMPGMDGMEVLRQVREIRPNIGIFMITAYGTIEIAVETMKLGALDFIQKRFSP
jgi:PAS domain S-box-containing protein